MPSRPDADANGGSRLWLDAELQVRCELDVPAPPEARREHGAVACGRLVLDAKQGSAHSCECRHHFVDDARVLAEMSPVGSETTVNVMSELAVRVSRGTQVEVLDPVLSQSVGEWRLGEAPLARQRKLAHVDDALNAGALEERDELRERPSLVPDGKERDGLSADRRHVGTLILYGCGVNVPIADAAVRHGSTGGDLRRTCSRRPASSRGPAAENPCKTSQQDEQVLDQPASSRIPLRQQPDRCVLMLDAQRPPIGSTPRTVLARACEPPSAPLGPFGHR